MLGKKFYYGSTRKVIIAFGALFNDIEFDREDENGVYQTLKVPLNYTPKEKFIRRIREVAQPNSDEVWIKEALPRMGFEMISMIYDASRKGNTMERISSPTGQTGGPTFMYNRVPYNFNFNLFIATRKFDDSLRIVEQILPYFTPEFQVKIIDKEDFGINTNIPIVLDAVDFEVDEDGSMEDGRRTILWTLGFTAKGYMYPATDERTLIKKSIIDISQTSEEFMEEYMAYVDPMTANEDEPHEIIEVINDQHRDTYNVSGQSGAAVSLDTLD